MCVVWRPIDFMSMLGWWRMTEEKAEIATVRKEILACVPTDPQLIVVHSSVLLEWAARLGFAMDRSNRQRTAIEFAAGNLQREYLGWNWTGSKVRPEYMAQLKSAAKSLWLMMDTPWVESDWIDADWGGPCEWMPTDAVDVHGIVNAVRENLLRVIAHHELVGVEPPQWNAFSETYQTIDQAYIDLGRIVGDHSGRGLRGSAANPRP